MFLTETIPKRAIREIDRRTLLENAVVTVSGYFYAVDFGREGPLHRVGKDRRCTCRLRGDCPAVIAVADYLKAGGERAPDPPPGYFPVAPSSCPVCGSEVYYVSNLSSKRRGAGWSCVNSGQAHYWEAHTQILRELFARNPWLFPPVIAPDGRVLYPGLRRDELITEDTIPREN